MRVYDYLVSGAKEVPDRIILEFKGKKISFRELDDEARRLGAALRGLGIQPGEAVGIMLPNIPQFASCLFAALMNGSFIVPFNVLLRSPEIRYQSEDSGVKLLFTWEGFLPQIEEALSSMPDPPKVVVIGADAGGHLPFADLLATEERIDPYPTDEDATVMIPYTSGTTGKPKGAIITNRNLIAQLDMTDEVFTPQPDDKWLCVLPLFHVFALNGILMGALKNRTTILLHTQFVLDDAVESLRNDDITIFGGVPTMYFYILKYPDIEKIKFPKLRQCFSGGAAMPVEVMKRFEEIFNVPIYEGYGLTETTVSVCCNRPGSPRKAGSIGLAYGGVQIKIRDEKGADLPDGEVGEIVVKAPNLMKGYLNKPEATAEAIVDGWFLTGDLGHRDADGYYFIVDRKKDMIIKGGYNIYPREIEEVIYQLPEVAEAAVVGVFDEAKGEVVRAVIALKPEQALSEEAIRTHLTANLAKYKLPEDYLFVEELPKGPTGKILKREIKQNWDQWNKDRVTAMKGAQ